MRHPVKGRFKNRLIRTVFLGGAFLIFLGCVFLLAASLKAPRVPVVMSAAFVIVGSFFAFLAVRLDRRSLWLFLAAFCILVGLFLFLSSLGILPVVPREWWPAVSIFAGLSLIPAGWHHYGAARRNYLVPAIVFIILGAVLLAFSLKIVNFSFRQFLIRWWHLLFILAGITLMLVGLGTKFLPDNAGQAEDAGLTEDADLPDVAGLPEDAGRGE